jgi:cobyrinic acid a,c-diamide synthase
MSSVFLSAAHKSSGKTTFAIGLCAVLRQRGLAVQPFKKGPDYIDPAWLGLAAGRPCYNLDYFVAGEHETIGEFARRGANADISLIEGNKGLHDGLDLDGRNSNAALAKAVRSPVILVLDVRGTIRGIAPLLIGYQIFDREVDIAGVVANLCGGPRHESKLRAAVDAYTDIPFLGCLANDPELTLDERHLGLVPGYEDVAARRKIERIADAVRADIDVDRILEIAQRAGPLDAPALPLRPPRRFDGLRIGIARDRAFGFYYAGDLDAFAAAGAELVAIDTLNDTALPKLDGLLIGGGFPERHAAELAANQVMRAAVHDAIEAGLPTYAECGGLMYLSQSLTWNGETYPMTGVLPARTQMHDKPQGRGYVILEAGETQHPWLPKGYAATGVNAHEFHYSSLHGLPADSRYAYHVRRGSGISEQRDGLIYKNLFASYCHLRNTGGTPWVESFLQFVARHKRPLHRAVGAD